MNKIKEKAVLLAAALLLSTVVCTAALYVPVYGEETTEEETTSEDKKAVPVLVVEGNTIYVDAKADGPWNVIQATVKFDPSIEVEDYGVMEDFVLAANDQGLMGFPAQNVTDEGEFIFTAVYTSGDGTGVDYDGHLFYITFKDTSEPVDFTMYDEFNYELLSAAVDGASEAVTYIPSDEVLEANEAQHEADLQAAAEDEEEPDADDAQDKSDENTDSDAAGEKESSSRSALLIIVVIAVVVLAAVAVVVSRKNGQSEDMEADGQDTPENEAINSSIATGSSDVPDNEEIRTADRSGDQKTETEELSGQDKD